jgi:hypothetical protein
MKPLLTRGERVAYPDKVIQDAMIIVMGPNVMCSKKQFQALRRKINAPKRNQIAYRKNKTNADRVCPTCKGFKSKKQYPISWPMCRPCARKNGLKPKPVVSKRDTTLRPGRNASDTACVGLEKSKIYHSVISKRDCMNATFKRAKVFGDAESFLSKGCKPCTWCRLEVTAAEFEKLNT